MNVRDLEYFRSVCKTKNFTKAAKELFISQPSITNSINRLEKELNSTLIIRNHFNKEVTLTEAGMIVKRHAEKIFNEIDEMNIELSKIKDKKIKLGIPPIIGAYFLPKYMSDLVEKNLEETIEFVEDGSIKMKKLILEGKVDIAIIGSLEILKDDLIESKLLKKDKFKICVSENHKFADKEKLKYSQIKDEVFIVLGNSYIHSKIINELVEKNKISPKKIYHTEELQTAKSLIAAGIGIGIMINMSVEKMIGIKTIDLEEDIDFLISIAVKKDHYLTENEKEIIETIRKKSIL